MYLCGSQEKTDPGSRDRDQLSSESRPCLGRHTGRHREPSADLSGKWDDDTHQETPPVSTFRASKAPTPDKRAATLWWNSPPVSRILCRVTCKGAARWNLSDIDIVRDDWHQLARHSNKLVHTGTSWSVSTSTGWHQPWPPELFLIQGKCHPLCFSSELS